ncbi:MAG: GNAT family N-acetyltransferase [Bacteroidota bacterium]
MVRYRQATKDDIEPLLDLIERGFSVESDSVVNQEKGREHRVLFSYLYSKKDWDPGWVYLAEDSGRLAAAVGFFPQRLFFEGIAIPFWAVSPVVTAADFRGKGYAGTCLLRGFAALKERGVPAVFLWGLPKYYPRFGFVPVLPRYKTKLIPGKLTENVRVQGNFRFVGYGDLPEIATLYDKGNSDGWLQPERDLNWWRERFSEIDIKEAFLKEVPFPKKENFLVWENNKGEIKGYLNFLEMPGQKVVVNESAVAGGEDALEMVALFAAETGSKKTLYIRGTPNHKLNAAAYRLGGTHLNPAPLAGMVKIIDWPGFLSFLLPHFNERTRSLANLKDGDCLELEHSNQKFRWVWHNSTGWQVDDEMGFPNDPEFERFFTKLILGFYDIFDLSKIRTKDSNIISSFFPEKYPFIWDNNYLY